MARKTIFLKDGKYIGEFPKDPEKGWEKNRRGVRRVLCKVSDLQHLEPFFIQVQLEELYQKRLAEVRAKQMKLGREAIKAKNARKNLTVSEALSLWLADLKVTNNDETAKMYCCSIEYYIDACGDHRLGDISREHNTLFLKHLQKPMKSGNSTKARALSAPTQKKHIRHLKTFLSWAYDHEYIDKLIRLKSPKAPEKDMETYTVSELDRLGKGLLELEAKATKATDKIKYKNLYRAYMLATNTLSRVAPIWCLPLDQIDLDKRIIQIQDLPEFKFQNKGMKWPKKPINKELYKFLKADLEQRGEKEKFYLDKGNGELWRKDRGDVSRQMSKVAADLGLPKIKPFHWGMRATLITQLFNKGVDPQTIQMLADHSSIATTMKYRNTRAINQRLAAEKLEDAKK